MSDPDSGTAQRRKDRPILDEDQLTQRARDQVEYIISSLGGREFAAWYAEGSDDPADFEYLYRPGRIVVRDQDIERVQRTLAGGQPESGLVEGVTLFKLPAGLEVPDALARLDASLGVGVATPDHILHLTRKPTGSCCPQNEPEVVPAGTAPWPDRSAEQALGRGVLVSVVDSGWYADAVGWADWLKGVTGDAEAVDPDDIHRYAGHGTFIAGIVRCLAPSTEVRVEGFLPKGGAVYESAIVVQLLQALQKGPDVISLSAGASTRKGRPLLCFEVFWERHLRHLKGTVLVAAAGNDGAREPFWPAAFPWALSVGALRPDGMRAKFTNFGSWVDVYADGVDLINAYPKRRFVTKEPPIVGEERLFEGLARWSGTSFSTPIVAGLIAARMSVKGETASTAATALLERARAQARPHVGPWLAPGQHV